jgi:hypothetical protein
MTLEKLMFIAGIEQVFSYEYATHSLAAPAGRL